MAKRIEMLGGLGSGKTTLAHLIEDFGSTVSYEQFSSVPFWKEFYVDPGRYAFETEIGFLLQHYHQIKRASDTAGWTICDFSLIQDRVYAEVNLTGSQKDAFLAVYDEIKRELGEPDLLIHLTCGEDQQLRRMQARGRAEETNVDRAYLSRLRETIPLFLPPAGGAPQLHIDTDVANYVESDDDKKTVRQQIKDTIGI